MGIVDRDSGNFVTLTPIVNLPVQIMNDKQLDEAIDSVLKEKCIRAAVRALCRTHGADTARGIESKLRAEMGD